MAVPQQPVIPSQFVAARGRQLTRDGRPFRFVGVNCFEMAGYADRADQLFAMLAGHGVKVVRFWAFQINCGPTGRDFARFDALVAAAKRHDVLLLPVLENHWEHCTHHAGQPNKPATWYEAGWKHDRFGGAPLTYREYIRAVAGHFRDEPQILAWQLVNEPEIYPESPATTAALRRFAVEAAREVKAADPHHLVSLGLLGLGQPATTGPRYRRLHQFRPLDLVTAHDHGYIYEPLAGRDWPRRENNFFADMWDAGALDKPFVATESGIALEWVAGDRHRRAELFRAKLDVFFEAGGAGYILWNFEPRLVTNFGFTSDDPVWDVIAGVAATIAPSGRPRGGQTSPPDRGATPRAPS